LHLIINDKGEIVAFQITPGNVSDVTMLERLTTGVWGKLFGDKGYISARQAESLFLRQVHLIGGLRAKMKQKLLPIMDKILLRKRS
jgi:IS5 family transposase